MRWSEKKWRMYAKKRNGAPSGEREAGQEEWVHDENRMFQREGQGPRCSGCQSHKSEKGDGRTPPANKLKGGLEGEKKGWR